MILIVRVLVLLLLLTSSALATSPIGVGIQPGVGANACVFQVTGSLLAPCTVMVDPVTGVSIVTGAGSSATSALGVQGVSGGIALTVSGAVTANIGTIAGLATQTTSAAILAALGTPLQAGGTVNVGNGNSNGQTVAALAQPVVGASDLDGTAADPVCALPATVTPCTKISLLKAQANAIISPIILPVNVGPVDCSGTIGTGGTAQNAFAALTTVHGFQLANVDSTAGSGEPLAYSINNAAAVGAAGSYVLPAPTATTYANANTTVYYAPVGLGTGHALSVNAATAGHKFSCTRW